MAPIRPSSKSKARAVLPSSTKLGKPRSNYPSTPSNSAFSTTKRDKRVIKHSLLISRIQKSAPGHKLKRRRPSKKLVANLNSLADALPDVLAISQSGATEGKSRENTISLKSKPGVRKKREKLEKEERERFGRNLAVLSQAKSVEEDGGGPQLVDGKSERWSALRAHIHASMVQTGG